MPKQPGLNADEKVCPWCAETVKLNAIFCKHCKRDIEPTNPLVTNQEIVANRWNTSEVFNIASKRSFGKYFLAANTTSADYLSLLAHDRDEEVRGGIADNPNAPQELLTLLAEDKSNSVRRAVANNPNTPVKILEKLGKDAHNSVPWGVFSNPQTPGTLLVKLAGKDESRIQEILAHPNTPEDYLSKFARSSEFIYRLQIARNPNCPAEILSLLSGDESEGVRTEVAENPNTPVEVLEQLVKQKWMKSHVASNKVAPSKLLVKLAKNKDEAVRAKVAANPTTPIGTLELLAKDTEELVRASVAGNPNTPEDLLWDLAITLEDPYMRSAMYANPNLPTSLIEVLARSKNYAYLQRLLDNPNTSLPHFMSILERFNIPGFIGEVEECGDEDYMMFNDSRHPYSESSSRY